jgi:hypothetical protein
MNRLADRPDGKYVEITAMSRAEHLYPVLCRLIHDAEERAIDDARGAAARARWLMLFFSSKVNCAIVLCMSGR